LKTAEKEAGRACEVEGRSISKLAQRERIKDGRHVDSGLLHAKRFWTLKIEIRVRGLFELWRSHRPFHVSERLGPRLETGEAENDISDFLINIYDNGPSYLPHQIFLSPRKTNLPNFFLLYIFQILAF